MMLLVIWRGPCHLTEEWAADLTSQLQGLAKETPKPRLVHVFLPCPVSVAALQATYSILGRLFQHRDASPFLHLAAFAYNPALSLQEIESTGTELAQFSGPRTQEDVRVLELFASELEEPKLTECKLIAEPAVTDAISAHVSNSGVRLPAKLISFGGTFDGIHFGHILALENFARLLCGETEDHRLGGIGISDDVVVSRKSDAAVAQPFTQRRMAVYMALQYIMKLRGFVQVFETHCIKADPVTWTQCPDSQVKSNASIICNTYDTLMATWTSSPSSTVTVCLTDLDCNGIGFAGDLADLEVLVLTPEVLRGGAAVNRFRESRGLQELDLFISPLVTPPREVYKAAPFRSPCRVETKMSSSQDRRRLAEIWQSGFNSRVACFDLLAQRLELSTSKRQEILRGYILPKLVAEKTNLSETIWKERLDQLQQSLPASSRKYFVDWFDIDPC